MKWHKLPLIFLLMAALTLGIGAAAFASDAKPADAGQMLDYFAQWQKSMHPSTRLINNRDIHLPDDAMCLICHDGAGFRQWADAKFDPEWGDDAKLEEIGPVPTADCLTCHDQQAEGAAKLRITGATPMLRGGFKVEDPGKATACIICHNSRRGYRNDTAKPVADFRAPHEASSADMVYAQNFYFVPNGEITPHAGVDDSCVSCHVSAEYKGGGHTFAASWDSCKACHEEVDGAAVKKSAMQSREDLKAAIDSAITKAANAAAAADGFSFKNVAWDETEDKDFTVVKKGEISGVDSLYFHGGQAFWLMLDGKKYMTILKLVQFNGLKLIETEQGQVIAKAGWNLNMVDHDRSHGAHNAPFQAAMVKASIAALEGLDFSEFKPLKK